MNLQERNISMQEASVDILKQLASLQMSAITTEQQESNQSNPMKSCLCTLCIQWSIKTVSSVVTVAFQQHYPSQSEFIFPAKQPLFPAHYTLTVFLQQIKAVLYS